MCFTADGLSCVLTYLCFSLNKFGKAHGSDLAPCDFVLGRPSPQGAFTLFGSTVLAELPQSVRDLAPNLPRFVESCFLHPVFDSMAIKVRALVRIEGELVLKTFSATSVKPCVPLSWKLELLDGVLNTLGGGPGLPMPNEERVVLEPPVSTQVPSSGPPVEFVKNHGYTAGCTACSNIESGRKGSRVHNQACRRRYALWLSEQLTLDGAGVVLEPNPVEQQGPQEPSAGSGVPRDEHGRRLVDDVPGDLVSGGRERVEADVAMGSSGDAQFVEPPVALPPEGTSHRAGEPVSGSSEQLREEGEQAAKRVRTTPPVPQDPPSLLKRNPRRVSSDVPVSLSPGSGAGEPSQKGVKRQPEVDVVDLEEEIKATGPRLPRRLEGLFWASDASETVVLSELVTRPEMWCAELNSVKFEQSGLGCESVPLGGKHVFLWRPSGGVDDSTLEELPGPLVFEGMLEELRNLERCKTGRVVTEAELQKLKAQNPRLRVISSRWVCARKNPEKVRS